jgi:hypothetical protein
MMSPQLALAGYPVGASVSPRGRRAAAPRAKAAPRRKSARTATSRRVPEEAPLRTSQLLRNLLEQNKDRSFTVEKISAALGTTSFGASLLVFSIPEVLPLPIPGMSAIVTVPTAIISWQMIAGYKQIRLPKWLLKRSIPRKALAGAIKSILPVLERAERATKPRGRWASSPLMKRLLGVFIFLMAMLIALPIPVTNIPPAIAIFVTSLGMIERDGVMIAIGVIIGLASLVLIGGITLGLVNLIGGLLPF